MHPAVAVAFRPLSEQFEGVLREMYVDVKNLVTTGIGNLIDASANPNVEPWSPAIRWQWQHKDTGAIATRDEVVAEWMRVKSAGHANWGAPAQARFGSLALPLEEMERLFQWRIAEDEKILRQRFPEWDRWPADAQLGTLLISWAAGPGFAWPKTVAALKDRRFKEAAHHATVDTDLHPKRAAAIIGHLTAAAIVLEDGRDPAQLHFVLAGGR